MKPKKRKTTKPLSKSSSLTGNPLFQQFLDKALVIFWAIDLKGNITHVSGKGLELLGFRPAQMIGKPILELYHDESTFLQDVQKALKGETFSTIGPVGNYFFETRFSPLKDKKGKLLGVAGFSIDITEHRMAEEEALQRRERHFRAITEHSHDLVYILDRDGKRIYESPMVEKILGYKPGERKGTTIFDFLHPDDRDKVRGPVRYSMEKPGATIVFEARIRHKDGRWVEMEIAGENLLEDPTVRGVVINARDITERKLAENELRLSERRFRALTENALDVTYILNKEGKRVYESPSVERVLGFKVGEREGVSIFDNLHPQDVDNAIRVFREAMASPGTVLPLEVRTKHKDGRWINTEVNVTSLMEEPSVNGVVINFKDITARRLAENTLRQSEEKFRSLIENSHDVVALIDPSGRSSYISPSYEKILGYRIQDRLGQSFFDIVHPEDLPRVRDSFTRIAQNPGATDTGQLRVKHHNGQWRYVEASVTNHMNNPLVRGIILNYRDVTSNKEVQEALQLSEERFRNLIENSRDVVSLMDTNGVSLYISPSVRNVLGYDVEERVGNSFFQIVHPEDLDEVKQRFTFLAENFGTTVTALIRVRHKDGSWKFIEATGTNHLENPSIQGIILNYRDVTERKQVEEALIKSEDHYRNLIENSYDLFMILDREGKVSYISPSAARITGFEPSERMDRDSMERIHPDDQDRIRREFRDLVGKKIPYLTTRYRVKHKNGSWIHMEGTANNLLDLPSVKGIVFNSRDVTENLLAEEALRKSEENFRTLIEKMPDPIVVHANSKITYVNEAYLRLLKYEKAEELIGRDPLLDLHPEEREAAANRIGGLKPMGGYNPPVERRFLRKDGAIVPVEIMSISLSFQSRTVIMAVLRDLTERKDSERVLRQSEEKFRNLIENSNDVVAVFGSDGVTRYVSPTLWKVMGYLPEERIGRSFMDMVHPEDLGRVQELFRTLLTDKGSTVYAHARMKHRDGSWRYIEASATNLLDNPSIQGIILNYRDVTKRQKMEDALRRSEESFRTLIENSPDVMIVHSMERIHYVNRAALKLTGYEKPEDLIGQPPEVMVPPEYRGNVLDRIKSLENKEGYNPPVERKILRKNGETVPVEVVSFSINFEGMPMVVAIMRDLTERKNAEQALLKYERLGVIGEMAAGMAHENPQPPVGHRPVRPVSQKKV